MEDGMHYNRWADMYCSKELSIYIHANSQENRLRVMKVKEEFDRIYKERGKYWNHE